MRLACAADALRARVRKRATGSCGSLGQRAGRLGGSQLRVAAADSRPDSPATYACAMLAGAALVVAAILAVQLW